MEETNVTIFHLEDEELGFISWVVTLKTSSVFVKIMKKRDLSTITF